MDILQTFLLIIYFVVIGLVIGFILIRYIKIFDKNKYYFMPFWSPSPEYYYPEWKAEYNVEINYVGLSHYHLYGFISKPVISVKQDDIIILYFHGNAGNIYFRIPKYLEMIKHLDGHCKDKKHVLVSFDYRGFGCSNGVPSAEGILEDGLQMVAWCKSQFPNNKIIYYGESIGTSVVAYVSQIKHLGKSSIKSPDGIILKSPFTSMSSLVADKFYLPYWLPEYFIPNDFRTLEWLDNTNKKIPIIIMHNRNDSLIPTRNIKPLLDKYISIILEGEHNDCDIDSTWLNSFKCVYDKLSLNKN